MSEVLDGIDDVVESPIVEATPEPQPEVKAPEAKAEEPKQEPKTIPLAAHLEERKQYRAELEAERKARTELEARLAKLEKPTPAPVPQPEFIEDPKGYVDHSVKTALEKLNEVQEQVKATGKTAEQVQEETRFNRFMSDLQATEAAFKQTKPDYIDALEHIREIRQAELLDINPNLTKDQLREIMSREELGLAYQLTQQGRNPHEVAYRIAERRGYKAKGAVPPLPEVQQKPQLPPDQTLGSGAGSPNAGENVIPDGEEFDLAMKQMFGRKRA